MPTNRTLTTILAILAAFAGVSIAVIATDDDGDGKPNTITVIVGSTDRVVVDENNQADPDTEADEKTAELHEDARDETPPGVSREEADDALVTPPGVGPGRAPAGAQNYRCERHLVQNYSNRTPGTKVSMFVLHFTVSPPGSLQSIWRLFNTPSFGASSTLGLELDGECEQWVPFDKKPWTQGAFNSVSESVEIVCCSGRELTRAEWLAAQIIRRGYLANIVADRLRVRGLPARLVDPDGCSPKAGVTDHDRLECQNSHWDVGRNFPWPEFMAQVRRYYNGPSASVERSHRIVHAKLRSRCIARTAAQGRGCALLRARNRALHRKGNF